jgi:hypothetical protein
MLASGMPHEAIIAAVAEMEASVARDPVAEKRRAYDRARKREERANAKSVELSTGHPPMSTESADTADIADATPSPAPSPLLPPNPQQPPAPTHTPANTGHARKGTRLPEDWTPDPVIGPTADMIARWPPGSIERELEKFRNYWIAKSGKDAIKANWQRTWINWLISADERTGRNGHYRQDRPANDISDPMVRTVLARQAERGRGHGAEPF